MVQLWHLGANMDWHFRGTSADSPVVRLASASGLIAMAVITQVRMVSKPANPETCCTICDQYRIAGVVVCKNFRANTWHVGAVSLYNMFPGVRLSRILMLHWKARHSLGHYSLKTIHLLLWLWELLCWVPATDGRSPSFEYCANKQQATEATSENCWIFLGLKTNYPTNKQTNP